MSDDKKAKLNEYFTGKPTLAKVNDAIGQAQGEQNEVPLELTEDEAADFKLDAGFTQLAKLSEADKDGNQTIESYRGFPVSVLKDEDKAAVRFRSVRVAGLVRRAGNASSA